VELYLHLLPCLPAVVFVNRDNRLIPEVTVDVDVRKEVLGIRKASSSSLFRPSFPFFLRSCLVTKHEQSKGGL
jgi:hypothetical protein